nr:single-stranded DNA-binding protein [uncultured Oscillibacter sp.]
MLKITAIGNLTNDVELKCHEDGKPYAILRIASDRRYRDRDGNKLTDFISIKVRGALAERCAAFAWKGCKLAASGDFETITFAEDPTRQPGFLIKANEVEFLSPRRVEEAAVAASETQTATQRSGCDLERRSSEMSELSAAAGSEGYGACSDEAA